MNRNTLLWIAAGVLVVLLLIPFWARRKAGSAVTGVSATGATSALHEAARDGKLASVQELLKAGADPNAPDEQGKTPLHWSAANGHGQTTSALIDGGSNPNSRDAAGRTPLDYARGKGHEGTAKILMDAGGHGSPGAPPASGDGEAGIASVSKAPGLNPSLKFADLHAFERAIGQPGCLLTSDRVWLFAPKSREQAAAIVHPYLVRAYQELRRLTGVDTEYIIVVYNFPKGNREAFGGTSNCVIYYDDTNLLLDQQAEWTKYNVPHVSGYIEEMAHNFVAATKAQFGWEMVGWSIGVKTTLAVASNPEFVASLNGTYATQADTFRRYVAGGFTLPTDVAPNLVDRIHAYLLAQCEQQYGPGFWPDFFAEVRKEAGPLRDAVHAQGDDAIRDTRYRITVDCFDRLPGLHFKQMLQKNGISLTRDVKSLHPTGPGWNRRLM